MSKADQAEFWKPAIAVTWLMVLTGWRRGEVLVLRWLEVNLPRRTAKTGSSDSRRYALHNTFFSMWVKRGQ